VQQAINDIYKGGDLKGATIMFPPEQNNPLIDSFIIKDGIQMGVSHKGKQGAKASITNIWKAKEDAARARLASKKGPTLSLPVFGINQDVAEAIEDYAAIGASWFVDNALMTLDQFTSNIKKLGIKKVWRLL
jgi:hypothetical protein